MIFLKRKRFLKLAFLLVTIFSIGACKEMLDYSPYEVRVPDGDRDWNEKQLAKLNSDTVFKPFKIAFITDTHTEYDDFVECVDLINKMDSIDFIIHGGDITLSGISKEFTWYQDIIKGFELPIITLVGNHDYLSNGAEVYKTMFGATNFSFVYNNCKIVMFDDIIWENPQGSMDYDWLNAELEDTTSYAHIIPFSHIPPWDEQMDRAQEWVLNYIYGERNNIPFSFHGHVHKFLVRQYEDSITTYVCGPNMKRRAFLVLSIESDTITYEQVEF